MTITIGIDPGVTGAVAAIRNGTELIMLEDMPTTSSGKETKVSRSVDAVGLSELLGRIHPGLHRRVLVSSGREDQRHARSGSLQYLQHGSLPWCR